MFNYFLKCVRSTQVSEMLCIVQRVFYLKAVHVFASA